MELTQEQLQAIQEHMTNGLPLRSTALVLDLDPDVFFEESTIPGTQVNQVVRKARAMAEAERLKKIKEAADGGSITALQMLEKNAQENRYRELKEEVLGSPL